MSSSALPPMLLPSNLASSPSLTQQYPIYSQAYPQTPMFVSPNVRANSWSGQPMEQFANPYGWASSPNQYYMDSQFDSRNRSYYIPQMYPFSTVGLKHDSRMHHSFSDRPHLCNYPGCGRMFKRLEHLKRHHRSIHTNERPYHCLHPKCNKSFSRSDNLAQHMRIHRQTISSQQDLCNNCPC
ncbi:hypothetical protein DSO57_1026590 [Entomophthora muscae]|uniref:Uncharacterized protein n=3 Tax=Entomophthora muscae TaxID=34485 RepID=A0ACC2RYV6_9FUNG|nr:hypothetical protein DSO57_1038642 [Entomophthora muscae]KAJ9055215.1 hypothetical protein DSO57_1006232 [Entomophthora muscae]KAJ9057009.1 hypothetical protein DSO57_1026590 [Entomophthora muscae]